MAKCKVCGYRLGDGMTKCPMCGAAAGSTEAEKVSPELTLPKYSCPACGAQIIGEHRYCTSCGADLKKAAEAVQENRCVQCGTILPAEAEFCFKCGVRQIKENSESVTNHAQKKDEGTPVISVFADRYQHEQSNKSIHPSSQNSSVLNRRKVRVRNVILYLSIFVFAVIAIKIIAKIKLDNALRNLDEYYSNIQNSSAFNDDSASEDPVEYPDMIFVEGGTFQMGNIGGEDDEKSVHSVTVSSFYMCDHEVTQEEYRKIMGTNPSYDIGDNLPVNQSSWYNAIEYCNARSLQEGLTPCYAISGDSTTCNFSANGYRLPTEAEWEYAARGGKKSNGYTYSGSNSIRNVAWYSDNAKGWTQDVKTKSPNELGLYDMSGNVWEWCWDRYGEYPSSSQTNPTGASSGSDRVIRGGTCNGYYSFCSVAFRLGYNPSDSNIPAGFRVVHSAQ